jgi:cell division protein FtsB
LRSSLLVLGLAVCAAMLAVVDRDSGIPTWLRLRSELAESDARVRQLEAETIALRGQIEELRTRPWAIERAIREDLDLARPGEVLVRFRQVGTTEPIPPHS